MVLIIQEAGMRIDRQNAFNCLMQDAQGITSFVITQLPDEERPQHPHIKRKWRSFKSSSGLSRKIVGDFPFFVSVT